MVHAGAVASGMTGATAAPSTTPEAAAPAPPLTVVVATSESVTERAANLAAGLGLPLSVRAAAPAGAIELEVSETGLALRRSGGPPVRARVASLATPRAGGADPLYRAVLAGAESVIDATAGLGADAFHLAARGVSVSMIERSAVVAALLADALVRALAGEYGAAAAAAAGRLSLREGDARDVLPGSHAGVVLLDPMFPTADNSASPKKGMRLFRELLPAPPEGGEHAELLALARRAATRRVVVKRALRAPPLAGVAPSGSLSGRTVRFDLYAPEVTSSSGGREESDDGHR